MIKMNRIHQNSIRKNHFKPLWAIILVIAILCITPISAEEILTFDNVKIYDEVTQTVTIANTFNLGRDISTIQLKTPLVYNVPAGYQKVAEFEVNLFDDTYTNAFEKMEFYDLNKGNEKFVREFDYKLLTYEEVWVDAYNKTIGHYETKEKWIDFDTKTLIKGKVTIGIFTEVYKGDNVEWIPTLFGKDIEEWATWVVEGHGVALGSNNANTAEMGITIKIGTSDISVSEINKVAGCSNKNNGSIRWAGNNTLIATQAFIGDTATLTTPITLEAGGWYAITVNGGAQSYYAATAGNFQVVETDFTWANGTNGGWYSGITNDYVWCVESLNYSLDYVATDFTSPVVTLNAPANTTNFTSSSIVFSGIVSDDINLTNVSLIINDVYNETNTSGINNSNYTFTRELADGDYTWNYEGCDNESQCTNGSARSFSIDTVYPALKVIYPNETITFHELNTNLQLNWSANDTHISSCWYNWNGTNVSVTCSDNTTNILINDGMNKNLTFYVNDTFGRVNSSFVSWNYRLFKNSETYDSEVFEGLSSTFSINLLTNGSDITAANLSYNSTNYLGTLSSHGSNNFTLTRTVTAPTVIEDTNKTFYWNITQGTLNYNLTGKNQTVVNLVIDNCTDNTIVLYNFTIRNEENLTNLSSTTTTARINLQIYGFATTNLIQEYTKLYTNINPFAVCLNSSLSTGGTFSNDVQVQYEATGYVTEIYHIQNETITSSDFNQNISLYDLNETDSQVFKIIFRDSSFLPVENALIKIYRKYVDEGLYRIVEIPMTDKKGETIAHLFLNEVIYKLEVVKYGTVLETFTDVIAVCQTPLVASCEIDLNAFSESITVPDFEEEEDFLFTLGYDNDTRIVSSVFSIPSGSVQTISLNVTREDSLGTAICTDSLLSSSGTLSCVVPTSFGNSTIVAKIYKEGVIQAQGQIKLNQTPFGIYGVNLVFLALFVLITLIGAGMSDNPIYTTIFLLVGVALLFALNLVANNGFIGATATILFLVVAVILVIIKGARRN